MLCQCQRSLDGDPLTGLLCSHLTGQLLDDRPTFEYLTITPLTTLSAGARTSPVHPRALGFMTDRRH